MKFNSRTINDFRRPNCVLPLIVSLTLIGLSGLSVSGAGAAEKVARIVFSPKEELTLERLDPIPLACRRGPFQLEIPVTRLASVSVIDRTVLELRFRGGGSCKTKVPKSPVTGEWSHGAFKQDWKDLRRIEILKPSKSKDGKGRGPSAVIRAGKEVTMKGVRLSENEPLKVRKGAFQLLIAWNRIQDLEQAASGKAMQIRLMDGVAAGGKPPKLVEGEWRGASLKVPGRLVRSIEIQNGKKKLEAMKRKGQQESPPSGQRSRTKTWGVVADDGGVRFDITGPPEFDGPFNFWNEIRQVRDRSYLPLAQGPSVKDGRTILIPAERVRDVKKSKEQKAVRYEVTLQSGRRYSGSVASGNLYAATLAGRIEIPISRISLFAPVKASKRPVPPATLRAVIHPPSGNPIRVKDPLLFYERKLRPDWKESGPSWAGGHTKPFLFVKLGSTVQRVSFSKLKRLEVPAGPDGRFIFANRDGSRLSLTVDWDRHREVEDLAGIEQVHPSGEAYELGHIGLVGRIAPGVLVHIPWKHVRAVDLEKVPAEAPGPKALSPKVRSSDP